MYTLGEYSTSEAYHEYIGVISLVHQAKYSVYHGGIMIHVVMYHECLGGCTVHRRHIMSTLGDLK